MTADTGVGNPAKATPEKGQKCLEALTARIGDFLIDLAKADPKDMYG
jgi:creatinine amidohydrolase